MVLEHYPSYRPLVMNPLAPKELDVIARAVASAGSSGDAIYRMVARALAKLCPVGGGTLLDVGCGRGELRQYVAAQIDNYVGADVVRHEGFPAAAQFLQIDLDAGQVPMPDASAEVVAAIETIEHLENPRALFRELKRLVRPGGWTLVTTPNQLSLLSKITLLTKGQFNAFQEAPGLYPAHLTALLEIDLLRIAQEVGFQETFISYSHSGRIPFTSAKWPCKLGLSGRAFSDNLLIAARAPVQAIPFGNADPGPTATSHTHRTVFF